jgi:hypothetical protein
MLRKRGRKSVGMALVAMLGAIVSSYFGIGATIYRRSDRRLCRTPPIFAADNLSEVVWEPRR